MRILAIDTAVEACSLSYTDGAKTWSRSDPMTRGHAERLFPLFDSLKAEIGWTGAHIPDRIVVTTGPGTFTGARVGLATGRAMALAWDRPCLGISTLEALAASIAEPGAHIGVIDARRGQVYAQAFGADDAPLVPPLADSPGKVWARLAAHLPGNEPVFLAGSGAGLLRDAGGGSSDLRETGINVPDAAALLGFGTDDPAARAPKPLYLRPPDAKPPSPPPWMQAP